jgi:aromatic ring hydroxylase
MSKTTGNIAAPPVQIQMGELAAWASIVEGMLDAQETNATLDSEGVLWPSKAALYSVMALQSEIHPRMVDAVRELSGAAVITLPSSIKDFESSQTAPDIERYFRSANGDARSRTALMRLVWDFVGSEFGVDPSSMRSSTGSFISYQVEHVSLLRLRARGSTCRERSQSSRPISVQLPAKIPTIWTSSILNLSGKPGMKDPIWQ